MSDLRAFHDDSAIAEFNLAVETGQACPRCFYDARSGASKGVSVSMDLHGQIHFHCGNCGYQWLEDYQP